MPLMLRRQRIWINLSDAVAIVVIVSVIGLIVLLGPIYTNIIYEYFNIRNVIPSI